MDRKIDVTDFTPLFLQNYLNSTSLQGVLHLVILSTFPLTEKDEAQQTMYSTRNG